MSRRSVVILSAAGALVLALGALYLRELAFSSAPPPMSLAPGRRLPDFSRPPAPRGTPPAGRPGGGTPADAPSEHGDGPRQADVDMPTTAKGFYDLLRELSGRNPMDTHEGQEYVVRVGYAFHDLLQKNAVERTAALALFKQEDNPFVLEVMCHVFGGLKSADVSDAMGQVAMFDTHIERRKNALSAIGFYQSLGSIPVALQVIRQEPDPKVTARAIEALPDLPPQNVTPAQRADVTREMTTLSSATDPYVRGASLYILGEWGGPEHVSVISRLLTDEHVAIRAAAAFNLVPLAPQSPEARATLIRVLRDESEDVQVRGSAADALKLRQVNDPELNAAVRDFFEWEARNLPK